MIKRKILSIVVAIVAMTVGLVTATQTAVAGSHSIKPAVVFDMGGKFDKSFNEGVWNGVKKFTEETGIEVMEFEVTMRHSVSRRCAVWLTRVQQSFLVLGLRRRMRFLK